MRPAARLLLAVSVLAALLWRLGAGPFLDAGRLLTPRATAAALAVGAFTTLLSAWRWATVAGALGLRLPVTVAVRDYYRALFLNGVLPGGVAGDVHRAVRHGREADDARRAATAVVVERVAGQVALAVVVLAALVAEPAAWPFPVPVAVRVGGLAVAALVAVVAVRHRVGPRVALASVLVVGGHLALFLVAADAAAGGRGAPPATRLVPLGLLLLVAMGLPLNVGGWGPREGVAAWAFAGTGLGGGHGVTTAVLYGVLALVASAPGAAVLLAPALRRMHGRVHGRLPARVPVRIRPPAGGPVRRRGSGPAPQPVAPAGLAGSRP